MAKYKVIEPNEDKLTELARISFNLRYYSKIWRDHFGSQNRNNMSYWEGKMDEFLSKNIEVVALEEDIPEKVEPWPHENTLKFRPKTTQ